MSDKQERGVCGRPNKEGREATGEGWGDRSRIPPQPLEEEEKAPHPPFSRQVYTPTSSQGKVLGGVYR